MSGFFDRMLGRGKDTSAKSAKERLQFVLVHDRINLPPERLQEMKEEILNVISRYVAVSAEEVDIALEQRDRNSNRIVADIPFSKSLDTESQSDEDESESSTEEDANATGTGEAKDSSKDKQDTSDTKDNQRNQGKQA